ncbi:hypothetical protein GCM10022248_17750 [Nonomuraea soli]
MNVYAGLDPMKITVRNANPATANVLFHSLSPDGQAPQNWELLVEPCTQREFTTPKPMTTPAQALPKPTQVTRPHQASGYSTRARQRHAHPTGFCGRFHDFRRRICRVLLASRR